MRHINLNIVTVINLWLIIKKRGNKKYFSLKFCSLVIVLIFLTGTHCIDQLDFELEEILLSLLLVCWD